MAVRAEGMGTSRFYECVAGLPLRAVALQRARENKPPAHVSRRAVGRRVGGRETKARFTMDMHEDDLSQLSDRMLKLLLKAAAPEKYGKAATGGKGGSGKRMGPSNQSSVNSNQFPTVARVDAATEGSGVTERVTSAHAMMEPGTKFSNVAGSRGGFVSEDIGGEIFMIRDCPEFSNLQTEFAFGDCPRRRPAADVGVSRKRTGWCRPFRALDFLLCLPGVARSATPGYSNGIPPGCGKAPPPSSVPHAGRGAQRSKKIPEFPEWGLR